MRGEEDIDALARELLYSDAVTPPDALWAGIESRLAATPVRKPAVYRFRFIWFVLVLMLVIPAAALLYRNAAKMNDAAGVKYTARTVSNGSQSTGTEEAPMTNAVMQSDSESDGEGPLSRNDAAIPAGDAETLFGESRESGAAFRETTKRNPNSDQVAAIYTVDEKEADTRTPERILPESTSPALLNTDNVEYSYTGPLAIESRGVVPFGKEVHTSLTGSAIEVVYGPESRRSWLVGVYADLRSTSLRITAAGEGSAHVADSLQMAEFAATNGGVGLFAGYHISPQWRLSAGIAFAKWCRTTTYPVAFYVPAEYVTQGNDPGTYIPLQQEIFSATGYQTLNVSAPSPVVIDAMQAIASSNTFMYPLEIRECYDILQLPLSLEYYHAAGRFGLLPGIGFNYEHILKRSAEIVGSGSGALEGTVIPVEKSPGSFVSLAGSLHCEYLLTERLSLRAGGAYRAWLTPIYSGDQLKTYPRVWTIDAGVVFNFYRGGL